MNDAGLQNLRAWLRAHESMLAIQIAAAKAARIALAAAEAEASSIEDALPLKVAAHIEGISYEAALKRAQRGWGFKGTDSRWYVSRAALDARKKEAGV